MNAIRTKLVETINNLQSQINWCLAHNQKGLAHYLQIAQDAANTDLDALDKLMAVNS